jgi:hypothetical protein
VGVAVFVLRMIPDLLWPSYRSHGIFDDSLVGSARSSVPADLRSDPIFIAFRVFGSVAFVPILEERFRHGWLDALAHPPGLRGRPSANVHTLLVLGDSGPSLVSDAPGGSRPSSRCVARAVLPAMA